MPSLYRCRKVVVLKSEDELVEIPREFIVRTGIDFDDVVEVTETLDDDGEIFDDRCSIYFSDRDNIMAVVSFDEAFKAWQEATNTAVLLRRFG